MDFEKFRTYTYGEGFKSYWVVLGETQNFRAFLGWGTSAIIFGLISRVVSLILFGN